MRNVFLCRMVRMEKTSVSQMVSQARKGSESAYEAIFAAFGSKLLGYFYRNTGNLSEAEDLLQETFLRVVRSLKRYKEKERFEVWLFKLAHNLLIDYWRKRKMIRLSDMVSEDSEDDNWLLDSKATEVVDDPASILDQAITNDELQRAIEKLSLGQREMVLMRYFSGLSFEEIAQTNGVPIGTALARVHRGLKQLKRMIGKQEGVNHG